MRSDGGLRPCVGAAAGGCSFAAVAISTSFGDFLIREGELAGGAGAVGGSVGLIVGAIAKDLGADVSQWELAARGAALGALFGIVFGLSEHVPWG